MTEQRKLTMVQAINLALMQEMERDDDVLVLGEDIGVDGGVFRVTDGLLAKFGEQRVIDTPLAEGAIVGMAIGMAIYGLKPVPEIQFSGFSFQAFHQIENHAARYRARTRGRYHVQMVVRMPYGGGVRALEHHSESEEAYYAHTPGLKIVIPSSPRSARALLVSAIRDPDTVIFFEPKALYHAVKEEVPVAEDTWPIGKARVARAGQGSDADRLRGDAPPLSRRRRAGPRGERGRGRGGRPPVDLAHGHGDDRRVRPQDGPRGRGP